SSAPRYTQECTPSLGGGVTVTRQTLDLLIGVRIPASQPVHCNTLAASGSPVLPSGMPKVCPDRGRFALSSSLFFASKVDFEAPCCFLQVAFAHDVVAVEDRPRLVAWDPHANRLRHAR